jgi:hypothetical protein
VSILIAISSNSITVVAAANDGRKKLRNEPWHEIIMNHGMKK